MMRTMPFVIASWALMLAGSSVAAAQQGEKTPPAQQSNHPPAPALALRDTRGRTRRLGDYRGQVVLVNFWATWCPPCRAEMPDLVELQREYGRSGLRVLGVTYPDDDRRAARALIRRLKVNYPILWGTAGAVEAFGVGEALPVTIVIDRRGLIREQITGILLPEEFTEKIAPLLRETR